MVLRSQILNMQKVCLIIIYEEKQGAQAPRQGGDEIDDLDTSGHGHHDGKEGHADDAPACKHSEHVLDGLACAPQYGGKGVGKGQ